MLFGNCNVLKEQGVIATKTNVFEGKTTVNSFHYFLHCDDPELLDLYKMEINEFLGNAILPIALYESKQSSEQFFIVVTSDKSVHSGEGSLTINLNGSTNIKLIKEYGVAITPDELLEMYPKWESEECEKFISTMKYPEHHFFPITKEDFLKCCQASTISFQLKKNDYEVVGELGGTGHFSNVEYSNLVLSIFRALYSKVVDSSMFVDAEKKALEEIISVLIHFTGDDAEKEVLEAIVSRNGLELRMLLNNNEQNNTSSSQATGSSKNGCMSMLVMGVLVITTIATLLFTL